MFCPARAEYFPLLFTRYRTSKGVLFACIVLVSFVLYLVEDGWSDDFDARWSTPYKAAHSVFMGFIGTSHNNCRLSRMHPGCQRDLSVGPTVLIPDNRLPQCDFLS